MEQDQRGGRVSADNIVIPIQQESVLIPEQNSTNYNIYQVSWTKISLET